ncbi:MAG: homoserine kinase, partial [Bacteroidota bacterium]
SITPSERFSVSATGPGSEALPRNEENLTVRVFRALFAEAGKALPAVHFHIECGIPLERGLGSSAAAVIAGLVGANRLLGSPFSPEELLERATRWEGHPDNVAPALFGGLVASWKEENSESVRMERLPLPIKPGMVLAVPPFTLSTEKARAAIPRLIPLSDAVFNLGRVTMLTFALTQGRLELLANALRDRLHEPYRESLVPGMALVREAAETAGAWGVVLSGAGPTLLAFCPPDRTEQVARTMQEAWPGSRAFPCPIEDAGTCVHIEDEK